MIRPRFLLVAASLLAATVAAAQAADSSTWQVRRYLFAPTGDSLPYGLFVPANYDATKRWPLMVALHGAGGNHTGLMRYDGMLELAARHGFIVVTPLGLSPFGGYGAFSGLRVCTATTPPPPACERGILRTIVEARRRLPDNVDELSEQDVMNVIGLVRRELSIDSTRVFLFGHSMGGGGTYRLASRYPAMWKALAVVAPAPAANAALLERFKHLPVLVIQGDSDRTVRVDGTRATVEAMKRLGMRHEYIEVPGGDHSRIISRNEAMLGRVFTFFLGAPAAPQEPFIELARFPATDAVGPGSFALGRDLVLTVAPAVDAQRRQFGWDLRVEDRRLAESPNFFYECLCGHGPRPHDYYAWHFSRGHYPAERVLPVYGYPADVRINCDSCAVAGDSVEAAFTRGTVSVAWRRLRDPHERQRQPGRHP